MTAKEAREKTQNYLDNVSTMELEEIKNLILNAVQNGEFCIYIDFPLSGSTKNQIKKMGYFADYVETGLNESSFKISWEDA